MDETREMLFAALESHYRANGWAVERADDGTVRARGWGGVTWIGLPVTQGDLDDPAFDERLRRLAAERMPAGELCPLELLPDLGCDERLRMLLERLRLAERGHVEVYALAA